MKRHPFLTILLTLACLYFGYSIIQAQVDTPTAAPPDSLFSITEFPGSDGNIEDINKITNGKLDQLLPFNVKLYAAGNKVQVMKVPVNWVRGASRAANADNRTPTLYLFGFRAEDQVYTDAKGASRIRRPYFAGVTTGGSVIRGRDLRRMNLEELTVICRVIGQEITFIQLGK